MRLKKEGKSLVAREYWTSHWHKEPCLSQVVNVSILLFFQRMPSHAKKEPPPTHVILEASIGATLANIEAAGAVLEYEDKGDG